MPPPRGSQGSSRKWSRKPAAAVLTVAAGVAITGIFFASRSDNKTYYCANDKGVVVDEQNCDNTHGHYGGGYYFVPGRPGLGVGAFAGTAGAIAASDSIARSRAGLSGSGKVSNGVTVRSGGFGGAKGFSGGGS